MPELKKTAMSRSAKSATGQSFKKGHEGYMMHDGRSDLAVRERKRRRVGVRMVDGNYCATRRWGRIMEMRKGDATESGQASIYRLNGKT